MRVVRLLTIMMTSLIMLTGCSMPTWIQDQFVDPEEVLEKAASKMAEIQTMRSTGSTAIEGEILGKSYSYEFTNEGHTRLENGVIVEALVETSISGNGIQPVTETIYFSPTEYGIFDQSTQQWSVTNFHPQDQVLIDMFMSSLDPSNSINQYYNSKIEKKLKAAGKEEVNGINCIVIKAKVNADDMMNELSPVLKSVAGSAGSLASSLSGVMVKNMDITYWVGDEDSLIHRIDINLPTPLGNYTTTTTLYDHNAPFTLSQ
ncbi:hypothetical protein ACOJQI_20440 [Bacillus salacetis]|uniref:hypothetical protein n=1 Tax=Bacillus salacetis TaxID=2315464 RepID=UPI003BA3DC15